MTPPRDKQLVGLALLAQRAGVPWTDVARAVVAGALPAVWDRKRLFARADAFAAWLAARAERGRAAAAELHPEQRR